MLAVDYSLLADVIKTSGESLMDLSVYRRQISHRVWGIICQHFHYRLKGSGPSTEPCGIPLSTTNKHHSYDFTEQNIFITFDCFAAIKKMSFFVNNFWTTNDKIHVKHLLMVWVRFSAWTNCFYCWMFHFYRRPK